MNGLRTTLLVPEILARAHRGARRFLVVYFPPGWLGEDEDESFDLVPDEPSWWREQAVDRTLECAG